MKKKLYSILLLVWLLVFAACMPEGERYVPTQETETEGNEELTNTEDMVEADSGHQDFLMDVNAAANGAFDIPIRRADDPGAVLHCQGTQLLR